MFYHFLYPLRDLFFGFNVFKYITFRMAGSVITAFLLSALLGKTVISMLKKLKIGESVRKSKECASIYEHHKGKEGTPTMGGILILAVIFLSVLLWADLSNKYIWIAMGVTFWLGVVGFIDDYIKLTKKDSRGLTAAVKLTGQMVLGLIVGFILYLDPNIGDRLDIPFFKNLIVHLGSFYVFFVALVIIGASNAVNLTDGLDGLAIGCVLIVALTYSAVSYITGHVNFSNYLQIIYIPNSGELAVFCAAIFGAGLGFLWYNCHPADVFMGDTGALALGGALGAVAILIKKELLLVIVGGIFVAEAMSVIIQVFSYRLRGKRVFLMAPLHHHFQIKGWAESKVIFRFLIVAIVLALVGLSTLKLR
ncbi:MAG: phospho-N-acetylmuramoyl-pentapeptide-transferase [Candidatus Omnitrophica bacterium]|nr:phospho-N-acetylmuramoyl-pentapeptide-transferase [Candidatus Omnitrophota bacterium]